MTKLPQVAAQGAASYFAGSIASGMLGFTSGLGGFFAKELPAALAWHLAGRAFGSKPGALESALGGGISYFAGATAGNIIGAGGAVDYVVRGGGAIGGAYLAGQILG